MTIGSVIQRIQSLYSKGVQSDDSRLTPRHIYSKLMSARAMILLQQVKKKNKINSWSYQILSNIPTQVVNSSGTLKIGRSVSRIPKPITSELGHSIEYILSMSEEYTYKYDESNKKEMLHILGNKYTGNNPRYTIEDGYIYLYSKNIPNQIEIKMLAEDPLEAYNFSHTGSIDPFSIEFPLEEALVDVVIDIACKELIDSFKLQKEDTKQDSSDAL